MNDISKTLILIGGVAAFTVPVFSSGLKQNMNFAKFIVNHSIWGERPQYVPRELVIPPNGASPQYLVDRRLNSEVYDLREWITPTDPKVVYYASRLYDPDRDQFILNCWEWVCHNYSYRIERRDFWSFPIETLAHYEEAQEAGESPTADCEDTSYLLTSLLLAYTDGAYANAGWWGRELHAWTTVMRNGREYIFETTLPGQKAEQLLLTNPWIPADEAPMYVPLYKFDHKEVMDLTN